MYAADSSALAGKGVLVGVTSKAARLHITKLSYLLTGKPRDGERLFHLYGSDNRDGLLAPTELRQGFNGWTCLSLSSDGLDQLVHFIFLYADKASCFCPMLEHLRSNLGVAQQDRKLELVCTAGW